MRRHVALVTLLALAPLAARADQPAPSLFDQVVRVLGTSYYDSTFRATRLPQIADSLRPLAAEATTRDAQRDVVWKLLAQVPASHCGLLSKSSYVRMFADLRNERMPTLGVDLIGYQGSYYTWNVLEGGPAARAGIRPWQRVTAIDGKPVSMSPRLDWRTDDAYIGDELDPAIHFLNAAKGERVRLRLAGVGDVTVEAAPYSSHDAAKASVHVIDSGGRKIGYLHLWYVHLQGVPDLLREALHGPLAATDAFVLDLRGRGGNALQVPQILAVLDGSESKWRKPIVALIDRQSRSAKDVIAYEIKQRGLARLVGENSAGAVIPASFAALTDEAVLMYPNFSLPTYSAILELKGGVAPDVYAERANPNSDGHDPILERGIVEAVKMAAAWDPAAARPAPGASTAGPRPGEASGTASARAASVPLPDAKALAERVRAAYGSNAAILAQGVTQRGRVEVPGTPYAGPFMMAAAADGRFLITFEMGTIKAAQGFDGDSAWTVDPGQPRRALDPGLREGTQFANAVLGLLPWDAHVKSFVPDAWDTFEDTPCVRVKAADMSGNEWTLWIDEATHRLRGSRTLMNSPLGKLKVTTSYRDYRAFGGVATPAEILSDSGVQRQRVTVEAMEVGVAPGVSFTGR